MASDNDAGAKVSTIVFPRYVPGCATRLEPVRRSHAFLRLADAGYDSRAKLNSAWVGRVVDWIRGLRCFELEFSDLDSGVDAVLETVQ